MISILICFALSAETIYSLVPPFKTENVDEVGNWTMIGQATNMKNKIRLAHNLIDQYGKLCNRIPFIFNEWSLDVNFSIHGGPGGGKFYIVYSKQVCQEIDEPFTGWGIVVDIGPHEGSYSDVYLYQCKNQTLFDGDKLYLGRSTIINSSTPSQIHFSKRYDFVTIDIFSNDEFVRLYSDTMNETVLYGYVSLIADTPHDPKQTIKIDVDQVDIWPADDHYMLKADALNYTNVNRKQLDKTFRMRKKLKEKRRGLMPLMQKFTKEAQDMNGTLTAEERKNLTDAFKLVNEAIKRSQDNIRLQSLEEFIATNLNDALGNAMDRIEIAKAELDEVKSNVDLLYANLSSMVRNMIFESKNELLYIGAQLMVGARGLQLHPVKNETIIDDGARVTDNIITIIILIVCGIEVVLYVLFFLSKRKEFNRKYD